VLVFDRYEEGVDSPDFLCYKEVVEKQDWLKECDFLKGNDHTTMLVNQQTFTVNIKSVLDSNNQDSHIVIDNTPYPPKGVSRKFVTSLIHYHS
jgi:hypothetical protein